MIDVRKRRLDRAPGRSGRPQPNPLVMCLPRDQDAAFRAMVRRRGTTINALLKELARAELEKYSAINSRPNPADAVMAAGLSLRKEPVERGADGLPLARLREGDADQRRRNRPPPMGHDRPDNLR
jgi:hypothetical protein